jgi:hypothetical protein
MAVMYRAEDTRLERSVALKFLPEELAHHPQVCDPRFNQASRLNLERCGHERKAGERFTGTEEHAFGNSKARRNIYPVPVE